MLWVEGWPSQWVSVPPWGRWRCCAPTQVGAGWAGTVPAEMPRRCLFLAEEQVVSEACGLGYSQWTGNAWQLEKQWDRSGGLRGLGHQGSFGFLSFFFFLRFLNRPFYTGFRSCGEGASEVTLPSFPPCTQAPVPGTPVGSCLSFRGWPVLLATVHPRSSRGQNFFCF